MPRLLGALWMLAGICFTAQPFAAVLAPAIDLSLLRLPTVLGVLLTAIWLLAIGVDVAKWEAAARPAEK